MVGRTPKGITGKAVLYINSDENGRGFLYAEGSMPWSLLWMRLPKVL
jgi:hypothetical protein